MKVSVLSFPAICSPLPTRVDASSYPHLQGLHLADCSDSQDSIDVLIGSDYYWEAESTGIKGELDCEQSSDCFDNVRFNGERYEVELPWKENCPVISSDYELCSSSFPSLLEEDGAITNCVLTVPNP